MSRSTLIAKRLESRAGFRKPAAVIILALTIAYLIWRLTIFSGDWGFSLAFYISEVLAFILAIVMICGAWNYRHREAIPPAPAQKVDVFLPVYKEPLEMIRQTVRAAVKIRYPHATYILDDGKRDELRDLAEEFGAIYIRRPDNKGAKAGNMNHALKQANGDFIVVFDADHVAQPEAIETLLGFFEDKKVGLVIAPQDYYNLDGLQFMHHGKGRIWHDQSRFYNVSQGCKDLNNCATSCGTGAMYRRSAIDAIGGFAELTITEDMHVSLLLHEAGYRSVYFNESIAYGVAPADLADYYRTRERWAHGNLHVLKTEKPWKSKNLTIKQKLSYIELGAIYLECWQQLLIFLIPVLSLFFAWQPFEITPLNVLIVLGFPLIMMVLQDEQGCGMTRNWTAQLFAIARMPVQMAAWSAWFGRRISWRVSKKNLGGVFDWRLVAPQVLLTLISVAALIYGCLKIPEIHSTGPISDLILALWGLVVRGTPISDLLPQGYWTQSLSRGYSWDLLLISSFWTLYNAIRAAYWLVDTYWRTKHTHQHYRFNIPLLVEEDSGRLSSLHWISETELRVQRSANPPIVGDELSFDLWLPAGPLLTKAIVTKVDASGFEADFQWGDQEDRDRLCDALFSVDWHAEMNEREGYFPTLIEQFFQLLRLKPRPKLPRWSPGLMQCGHESKKSFVLVGTRLGEDPSQLIAFDGGLSGQMVTVLTPVGKRLELSVDQPMELQGWCKLGLDGCTRWKFATSLMAS